MATTMAATTATRRRDIVVIGCSAGGVQALPRILQQLPPDLDATALIVQHLAATGTPYLAGILQRSSQLPVAWAEQGARIERRRVMVAPPDLHLLLVDHHVQLSRTARENHARPSIDKLFRSAAATHGGRVIGVLLTGMLDDGVAGLLAIRSAGGVVIVQDPVDAEFPELPSRALQALEPDRKLAIDAIGGALIELVGSDVGVIRTPPRVALEAEFDREGVARLEAMAALGPQTVVACPDCHGPMWQVGDRALRRYRCYLGHAATARELLRASSHEVESALWSAVRALQDRVTTLETLAADAEQIGNGQSAESFASRAREAHQQLAILRQFMTDAGRPRSIPEPPEVDPRAP
jgi:two-component system, chemotaxis family, protein-glutamate methylesterase/glutaminase